MLLDKYLIDHLKVLGKEVMRQAGLTTAPKNYDEMVHFFEVLKVAAEDKNDVSANIIYQVLYTFVSSVEVRDRHASPRVFEDIFAAVFDTKSSDTASRKNPEIPKNIVKFDKYTTKEDWDISADLSSNKREKADVCFGEYLLSLKTLKGQQVDKNGKTVDKSYNNEINVGSFSYRALFKGILTAKEFKRLGDRKNGLGSRKQIRENVLDPIKNKGKGQKFLDRLRLFFGYVYEEDLLIVVKSDYRIGLYFIPNQTFVQVICALYERNEEAFQDVWNRWENNNLRFKFNKLLSYIKSYKLPYKKLVLDLTSFENNHKIKNFNQTMNSVIEGEFRKLIEES